MISYDVSQFKRKKQLKLFGTPTYSGQVTDGAKKRIDKAIDILMQCNPPKIIHNPVTGFAQNFNLNFVTLTIARKKRIPADEAYINLMKPFLRKVRQTGPVSYVWKAELQKRDQLHYHIVTNTFLHWQWIRNTWNNLQRKNRYLDEFALKHKHFDPNSTDVHATYKITDLAAYLKKYLSKNQGDQINGKTWDCSKDLKRNRFSVIASFDNDFRLQEGINNGTIEIVKLDHCTIFKGAGIRTVLSDWQKQQYDQWKK